MKSGEVIFTFPDSLGSVDKIVGNLFVMFSNSEKKTMLSSDNHRNSPPAGQAVTFSLQLEKVTKKSRR